MGQRIKIGDLAFLVGNLNIVTGNPVEHCTKGESGLFVSNARELLLQPAVWRGAARTVVRGWRGERHQPKALKGPVI